MLRRINDQTASFAFLWGGGAKQARAGVMRDSVRGSCCDWHGHTWGCGTILRQKRYWKNFLHDLSYVQHVGVMIVMRNFDPFPQALLRGLRVSHRLSAVRFISLTALRSLVWDLSSSCGWSASRSTHVTTMRIFAREHEQLELLSTRASVQGATNPSQRGNSPPQHSQSSLATTKP